MSELIVNFVETIGVMGTIEKRDYIHSHLHQVDEELVNEVYQRIYAIIEENDPIVGYEASGQPIKKSKLVADLKEAEAQIERGECLTIEELEKESEQW